MALGFGFNKTKVLSSAEKFVQQGKLQNAIAEYEKVIKEDPKDLTVLNTIGDLYARVGQNEKACEYFKKVGDQYAQNGFTVKAIAIYKKLTKLNPGPTEPIIKLAELYTQQGLFNDARSQYMQVADQLLKSGDNNQAARIFQKILELDPENAATQAKLADLYIKLGKKEEARNIYYSAAESLYARSSFDAADEALSRVLTLDPTNSSALLLRGMIAADSGDSAAAIQYLEQVPDLDSRPDALRALLRARLQARSVEGVEAIAAKLLNVHQDVSGLTSLAEWFVANQYLEEALKLYDRYTERFLVRGASAFLNALYPLINRVRESIPGLKLMLHLLQKAGDNSHLNEVMELLAHAHVQGGNFEEARDLYNELSGLEPENPLHLQNYKQMLARLGDDPMARPLTAEEGNQAFMVEELEHAAPAVRQEYTPTVEKALEAALTDAELFVSYNVPLKAIAPLEAALPLAPGDVNLNQRLASLYVRADRYADAARVCQTLSEIYKESGHQEESARYAEAAVKYSRRAGAAAAPVPQRPKIIEPMPQASEPPAATAPPASTVKEFLLDVPEAFFEAPNIQAEAAPAVQEPVPEQTVAQPETLPQPEVLSSPELPVEPATEAHNTAVSHDWESMLSVEHEFQIEEAKPLEEAIPVVEPEPLPQPESLPEPVPLPEPAMTVQEPVAPAEQPVAAAPEVPSVSEVAVVEDKIQEIQFYISQSFWDMALSGLEDLAQIAPGRPELSHLRESVIAGQAKALAEANAKAAAEASARTAAEASAKAAAEASARAAAEAIAKAATEASAKAASAPAEIFELEKPAAPHSVPEAAEEEFILDVSDAAPVVVEPEPLPLPKMAASAPAHPVEPVHTPPPKAAEPAEDILGDFVLDLEESLGSDFMAAGPPQTVQAPPDSSTRAAAASSASAASVPATPLVVSPALQTSSASSGAGGSSNGAMHDAESTTVLSDILAELQQDLGEDTAPAEEDPETHYNLGIAFKEMGLLDEAIGELQKVCHAVEHGFAFSQPIQAYTWLAQCLVDKGVPEAAVRWYEQAIKLPGLDHTSRCAIYYDLGSAYEASGNKKAALANFMEVYSSNIDFRDVASRIKVLKS